MAPLAIDASELITFGDAVAGHDGVLTDQAGSLIIKPCTHAEIAFYESSRSQHPEFAEHLPIYFGNLALSTREQREALRNQDPMSIAATLQAQEGQAEEIIEKEQEDAGPERGRKLDTDHAIVLENVAAGFVKPNVLDVKLGARLWGDDAPAAKRVKLDQVAAETTSGSLGFRIAGMRVWEPAYTNGSRTSGGSYRLFDKHYGRALTAASVRRGFEDFFFQERRNGRCLTPLRRVVLETCQTQLANMAEVLGREESRMYSASILLVYEGDESALEAAVSRFEAMQEEAMAKTQPSNEESGQDQDDESDSEYDEELPKLYVVKLIDFAHAAWTPGQGPDENVLQGMRSVGSTLASLLN